MRTRAIIIVVLALAAAACDARTTTPAATATRPASPAANLDDVVVIKVLSKLLGVREAEITPDMTLEKLSMDDLDLVEATMELEDELKISIPDDRILKQGEEWRDLRRRMTVHDFANVVRDCIQHPATRTRGH